MKSTKTLRVGILKPILLIIALFSSVSSTAIDYKPKYQTKSKQYLKSVYSLLKGTEPSYDFLMGELKNKALNKDTFDNDVLQLCTVVRS